MYGPEVAILLMHGSHDMRHIGFRRLTVVNETPQDSGSRRHTYDVMLVYYTLFPFV